MPRMLLTLLSNSLRYLLYPGRPCRFLETAVHGYMGAQTVQNIGDCRDTEIRNAEGADGMGNGDCGLNTDFKYILRCRSSSIN